MFSIHRFGSEEQKQEWLPRLAAGDAIGCFGLTEADFGSNPAGMRTRARGRQRLGAQRHQDVDHQRQPRRRGHRLGANRRRHPWIPGAHRHAGLHRERYPQKLSLRASVTSELVLDNVRLPASAQLPHAVGLSAPLSCLNEARFGIVFGALGAARDSLEAAIDYTQTRDVFDRPLSSSSSPRKSLPT